MDQLRDNFSQAIDPAGSSIDLDDVTVEVRLMQVAISLEALGNLSAMRRDGVPKEKVKKTWFSRRLNRIVQDVEGLLPFVDVANSWCECSSLFRAWIARELGVDQAELKKRISQSPQMRRWIAVKD